MLLVFTALLEAMDLLFVNGTSSMLVTPLVVVTIKHKQRRRRDTKRHSLQVLQHTAMARAAGLKFKSKQ
jgi:hypothetical protein